MRSATPRSNLSLQGAATSVQRATHLGKAHGNGIGNRVFRSDRGNQTRKNTPTAVQKPLDRRGRASLRHVGSATRLGTSGGARTRLSTSLAAVTLAALVAGLYLGSGARQQSPAAASASAGGSASSSSSGGGGAPPPPAPAPRPGPATRLAVVAPLSQRSPFANAQDGGEVVTWGEVLEHIARRLAWTDARYVLSVHDVPGGSGEDAPALAAALAESEVAVVMGSLEAGAAEALGAALASAPTPTVLPLGTQAPSLQAAARLGGRPSGGSSPPAGALAALLRWLRPDEAAKQAEQVRGGRRAEPWRTACAEGIDTSTDATPF